MKSMIMTSATGRSPAARRRPRRRRWPPRRSGCPAPDRSRRWSRGPWSPARCHHPGRRGPRRSGAPTGRRPCASSRARLSASRMLIVVVGVRVAAVGSPHRLLAGASGSLTRRHRRRRRRGRGGSAASAAANAASTSSRACPSISVGDGLVEHALLDQAAPVAGDGLGQARRFQLLAPGCSAWGRRSSGPTTGRSCTRAASGPRLPGPGSPRRRGRRAPRRDRCRRPVTPGCRRRRPGRRRSATGWASAVGVISA